MTDKAAEFKQQLRDLVDHAKAAGAGTQQRLAYQAHMRECTLTRSIGLSYPVPTELITRDLVTVCLRFTHPDMPPDQLNKTLRRWLDRREEAARHARASCAGNAALLGHPVQDRAAALVRKIADTRYSVVSALFRYLDLVERVWEFEKAFEEQVLRRRIDLVLRRTQREQLEAGYSAIQLKVRGGELEGDRLEKEVAALLDSSDLDGPDPIGVSAGAVADTPTASLEPDKDDFDVATKDRIRRTFKRIVLAGVHPDTSDAELSEFEFGLAVLRSEDYTLMEAFTIRHRDNIGGDEDGELLTLTQLTTRLQQYQDTLKRLDTRLITLEHTAASIGMNALDTAYDQMRREGDRLRTEITAEIDRIREVEHDLETLADHIPDADDDDGPELTDPDHSGSTPPNNIQLPISADGGQR
ncbi:hypothetical protein [Nocardia miyunensis]|uniref:hypothetical protein n=1 Tax=Nocardia miyunensis TaxID=282684 RepID=UPI00082EEFB3|nr:hypothetical protein [Nocardia miyunensis]